jgi:AraC family ethanolamine operon transcriptional activator
MLELEIPRLLLEALGAPEAGEERPDSPASRRLAMKRAREFIRENLRRAPTVREVCERSGFSWRTLDYAFREQIGMTPQGYLRAVRLDELRRLLRSRAYERVSEAANDCGFWHMGKLAADYRAQFGELPSETLGLRRGRSARREARAALGA